MIVHTLLIMIKRHWQLNRPNEGERLETDEPFLETIRMNDFLRFSMER